MLISSKNKNDLIVLGLLSYTCHDEQVTTEDLRELLEEYRQNDHYELFLYRQEDSENFIGLLAIEENRDESHELNSVTLHRVAVIPSFNNDQIDFQMYRELRAIYEGVPIIGSMDTVDQLATWNQQLEDEPVADEY
ncbi:hypothetical protein [Hutsoniella sourekii]|uniref:hypothetical protein n=1 Tax=Hutsoniella sourekii TaxID=87650 RepID=UPI000482DB4A|nr:hypothetical protein [Hutsoniella sourekii]